MLISELLLPSMMWRLSGKTVAKGKNTLRLFVVLSIIAVALGGCHLMRQTPEPQHYRAQIDGFRQQELALVRETVADEERAEALSQLLNESHRLLSNYADHVQAYWQQMALLQSSYATQRADFEVLLNRFNSVRLDLQRQLINLTDAMKRETTAEKWETLADFHLDKLNPRALAYDQANFGD